MADATEDTPSVANTVAEPPDLTDEVQDFRFLLSAAAAGKIPARGAKDFEPHGTNVQDRNLEASREAMRIVLSQGRAHSNKSYVRAVYDEVGNGAWVYGEKGVWNKGVGRSRRVEREEETVSGEVDGGDDDEGEGVEEDHGDEENVVIAPEDKDLQHQEVAEQSKKPKKPNFSRLWLLPEEALWLIEAGKVDIRWPSEPGQSPDEGLPMSLQGAYAAFIGLEKQGGLTLEQFKVYQYLKRSGFIVLRASENFHNVPRPQTTPQAQLSLFTRLWGKLFTQSPPGISKTAATGPLVSPGLYRDYNSIYEKLQLIPFHDPKPFTDISPPPSDPSALNITYHVYKAVPTYKKTSPGPPDFYISVLDARTTSLPTEPQFEALLRQTPYHAPNAEDPLYKKVKGGYRNVLLAVVDSGVISFLNISDAGFGCERLWGRGPGPQRGKGGSRGGRGRGRGRGRK